MYSPHCDQIPDRKLSSKRFSSGSWLSDFQSIMAGKAVYGQECELARHITAQVRKQRDKKASVQSIFLLQSHETVPPSFGIDPPSSVKGQEGNSSTDMATQGVPH